jgi:hypothetical protein
MLEKNGKRNRGRFYLTEQEHLDLVAHDETVAFKLRLDALVGKEGFPFFLAVASTHVSDMVCICVE